MAGEALKYRLGEAIRQSQADPACSSWLQQALLDAGKRDILDALSDAEALVAILTNEWEAISTNYVADACGGVSVRRYGRPRVG